MNTSNNGDGRWRLRKGDRICGYAWAVGATVGWDCLPLVVIVERDGDLICIRVEMTPNPTPRTR